MHSALQDVRHALRLLVKTPGFSVVAMLTLALGIGANTAIFSVVHAVLLRPLPYPDEQQLVRAVRTQRHTLATIAGYPDYTDWRDSGMFRSAGVLSGRNLFLETAEGPRLLRAAQVSGDFLPTLGVSFALGRNFSSVEEKKGEKVAIISHGLWTRELGADPQAVGKDIRLSGALYRVVGVLPANYEDPVSPVAGREVYVPMVVSADEVTNRNSQWLHLVARLKPEVSLAQARTVVEGLSERALAQTIDPRKLAKFTAVPLREHQVGETSGTLWLLLASVGFVLLIACANVSNLLLARANTRGHEMAIRCAVGASRGRLLRQLMTESVVLSAAGGVLALLLLLWGIEAVKAVSPVEIPRLAGARLDFAVFAFAALASVVCGVLFGVLPALCGARQDVMAALKNTRASGGVQRRRTFSTLLVGEVALTVVLLTGAALALQSFSKLARVDTGFDRGNALALTMVYAGQWDAGKQRAFFAELTERAEALPGVTSVGVVDNLPLSGSWSQYTTNYQSFLDTFPPDKAQQPIQYEMSVVGGDYFRAMNIPVRAGRVFSGNLAENAPLEVVVSQDFAQKVWGAENPVGRRVNVGGQNVTWAEVVGVVGNVRHRGLQEQTTPAMYAPLGGRGTWGGVLVVRSDQRLQALAQTLRGMAREIDRAVVVRRVDTFAQLFGEHTAESRFLATLLGSFAALALLLALVGTYGVLAYSVSQQRQEIGIRVALGAEPSGVLRMVMRNGMALVSLGVVIGIGAAVALSRYMRTMLFQVSPTDARTYAVVSVLLLVVAAIACYLPARRAAKTDPMVALRYE